MVGTGRLPPRRVTAMGGGLIGLCAGVALTGAVAFFYIDQQKNAATLSEAKTRSSLEGTISAIREENKLRSRSFSCAPLLYVAQKGEANALQVRKMMDQFPAFKTDPYKQLFSELGTLVDQQRQQSRDLVQALSASSLESSMRCKVAEAPQAGEPLWSLDAVSVSKDGWRGITP
jgi:hypothetical protein